MLFTLNARWLALTLMLCFGYWGLVEATGALFSAYGLLPAPIWPAASLAFIAVWYWQQHSWIGIFLGAAFGNYFYPEIPPPLLTAITIAFGSLAAVVIANAVLKRFIGSDAPLNSLNRVLIFLLTAGLLQAVIAATIGITAVSVSFAVPSEGLFNAWLKWAIADAAGVLFFTPLMMLWLKPIASLPSAPRISYFEFASVTAIAVSIAIGVYWLANEQTYALFALPFLLIGPLAWSALRFPLSWVVGILLLKEVIAFSGTLLGFGVLNATHDPYPIGTLGIILVSTAIGVHIVSALINELRQQQWALMQLNRDLEARVAERTASLAASEQRMRDIASTDELTHCATRRYFKERAVSELARMQRHATAMSFLMLDIDHFKYINDRYGHGAGDIALIQVVQRVQQNLRSFDLLGRIGGEEFAILLPNTSQTGAVELAQRILQSVEALEITLDEQHKIQLTVSIGVTEANHQDTLDNLLSRADQALYLAKSLGRNRVELISAST